LPTVEGESEPMVPTLTPPRRALRIELMLEVVV